MTLSRRGFLHHAAALPFFGGTAALRCAARIGTPGGGCCVILDSSCVFRESLEGYKASLSAAGIVSGEGSSRNCSFIVAPAASLMKFDDVRWIKRRVQEGACALLESGGIFLSSARFRRQKSLAQAEFGLTLLPAVKLWPSSDSGIPYVDFTWPLPARVRDFSRAIPLAGAGVPIAHLGGKVVALKCRLGAGTLIFLGSPLGPHLRAGDRDAERWFAALFAYGLS